MEDLSFDVLVIGAGAAGLMAALEIALTGRSVAVIEAKERTGGRMFTVLEDGLSIELGAEFVHGDLPLTQQLLKKAGAEMYEVEGSLWQHRAGKLTEQEDFVADHDDLKKKFKSLKKDKPVAQFLADELPGENYKDLRLSLQNYVEGYYAADTAKASTMALCEELTKEAKKQYRIKGGYSHLAACLEQECRKKGVQFYLSHVVTQLQWKKGEGFAVTEQGYFTGTKVLITVPIGVLQNSGITFFPALPQVQKAVQQFGFGHVVKIIMQFEAAFWKDRALTSPKDLSDLCFLFSEEAVPTWWTHRPKKDSVLIGWLGGPKAETMQASAKEEIVAKGLFSLSKIFNLDVSHLQQGLVKADFYNWSADCHFCGAYSYEVVGGAEAINLMKQPIEQTLFFAGEGLHQGPEIGTVEAALVSGRETAHRLIASFTV